MGLLTFFVFLLAFSLNVNFSFGNTFTVLVLMCVTLLPFTYRNATDFFRKIKLRMPAFKLNRTGLFWGIVLGLFSYTLLVNTFWPISDWDALAVYDFRAKVFLIDSNLTHAALSNGYFLGYPLLTSLAHLFVYQIGLTNPKFIYSLFYLSFVTIFYFELRKNVSENRALFFTVILSLVPEMFTHATVAYTNMPYVVYLCSGTFYLYVWVKKRERAFLFLSAFLIGLSSWVRVSEPFGMVPLLVVFLVSLKAKMWKEFIYYLVIVSTLSLPWRIYMGYVGSMVTSTSGGAGLDYLGILQKINIQQIFLVIGYIYTNVFATWGLIFLVFMVVALRTLFNWKRRKSLILIITLFFFVLLFVGTLIFSITFPEWRDIPDSARRLSMFLLPLMIYSIAIDI
jgi:hypothetical protein